MLRSMRLMQLKRKYAHIWNQRPQPELAEGACDPAYEVVEKLEAHYQRHADNIPLINKTPQRLRSDARMKALVQFQFGAPVPNVADIWNESIPAVNHEVPVRIYLADGRGPHPIIIFLHNGGWVYGDLDTTHATALNISKKTGAVIITIEYRLAPEFPFPAALQDCYAVLQWASKESNALPMRGDHKKIIIAGEGAGGNLAAVLSLYARDRQGPPIAAQILVDPILDLLHLDNLSVVPTQAHSKRSLEEIQFFIQQYIQDPLLSTDALVSPLHADFLQGSPPTIVAVAEFDLLQRQGKEFSKRLQADGVPVEYILARGCQTGFFSQQHLIPCAHQRATEILETALQLAEAAQPT